MLANAHFVIGIGQLAVFRHEVWQLISLNNFVAANPFSEALPVTNKCDGWISAMAG
ncbi:hypothetical protein [Sphingopyxis bauzanensis]|uniref:hypothetical protein n=1 Tax=Sphingopyxis bauzanensis TaxID=651663 RepID=UPI00130322CD|nr:hypothetical protein [Sphingopyxis bauzanensis]